MPEWALAISIAIIGAISGALPGFAALRKARTQYEATIRDSELAARAAALREWESLTQSQRATLEEYRTRLQVVTDRVTELERQLIEARHTIDVLERQGDEQARKIVLLEQERALWEAERTALRDRIAELEGCK